jgi:hypothetical protein
MTKAKEKELHESFKKFQEKEWEELGNWILNSTPAKRPLDPYPTVKRAKFLVERYNVQPNWFNQEPVVKILLQLRIVMSDYRFCRTLRKLKIPHDSAIACMAEHLNFDATGGEE